MRTYLSGRPLVTLLIACILGCGGSGKHEVEERYGAKGMVTLDGAPLAQGEIVFESPEDFAAGIPPGIGRIENGKYEATISTGKKVVRISSLVEAGEPDPTGFVPTRQLLPAKYNTDSQLEAVVTESGDNEFDFDLLSDKDELTE
jgi:hypothetical protein